MTEVVEPKAGEGIDPDNIDVSDYITASHHIDLLHKNYAAIGHKSDFITVAVTQKGADHLGVALDSLVVRFRFRWTKDGVTKKMTDNWDMDYQSSAFTVINDEAPGAADVNIYVEIIEVSVKAGETVKPSGGQASVRTDTEKKVDYTPYIIGIIILIVAAALVYWFFLRGRTVFGHTFGKPKIKAVAAPAAPAPAPVPPPAPTPAPEVKP